MPALEAVAIASLLAASFAPDPVVASFKGQQGVCAIAQIADRLELMCFKVEANDWIRSQAPIGAYDPADKRLCLLTPTGRDCRMLSAEFPVLRKSGRVIETALNGRP